ncbi:MAG: RNA 2',3'-cyclic phosphodiesterase [Armatimonadota bacterium]
MRLFAAVFPSEDVLQRLATLQSTLRARVSVPCSWTRRERMHLTLRFFGDDANPSLTAREVERALLDATAGELVIDVCSGFPNPSKARVLFAGASEPDERVVQLNKRLNLREREPVPHLTLGRPRRTIQVPQVEFEPIAMEVSCVSLVHSVLFGPQAGYHILETWTLPR